METVPMSFTWKFIFIAGALLFAGMAIYTIWFEALAPVVFAKALLTLVIGGIVLSVLESLVTKRENFKDPK